MYSEPILKVILIVIFTLCETVKEKKKREHGGDKFLFSVKTVNPSIV